MRKIFICALLAGSMVALPAIAQDYSRQDPYYGEGYNIMGDKAEIHTTVVVEEEVEYVEQNETLEAPTFKALDVDRDNSLSMTEFLNFQTYSDRAFAALDQDNNGTLSNSEYQNVVNVRVGEDGSVSYR